MKSQAFSMSMLIMGLLAISILFQSNYFYFQSKSKMMDYLAADEISSLANNHFEMIESLIGSRVWIEKKNESQMVYFESYLNSDFGRNLLLTQYKLLLQKRERSILMSYDFNGTDSILLQKKSQRSIDGSGMQIIHDYENSSIIFDNISLMESMELIFSFDGQMQLIASCANAGLGKKIKIMGPNGFSHEIISSNDCFINLSAFNGIETESIEVDFNPLSNYFELNYSQVGLLKDANAKIIADFGHENLFKISSANNISGINI